MDVGNYITKYNVKTDSKILYGLGASSASSSFVGHNMSRVGTRSAFENDVTLNFDVMVSQILLFQGNHSGWLILYTRNRGVSHKTSHCVNRSSLQSIPEMYMLVGLCISDSRAIV